MTAKHVSEKTPLPVSALTRRASVPKILPKIDDAGNANENEATLEMAVETHEVPPHTSHDK